MKYFLTILLIFSTTVFAGTPRGAFIKNGVIGRLAAKPDAKYKAAMAADGYSYVDVSNMVGVTEGSTCSKCDGSDFVRPAPPAAEKDDKQLAIDALDQRLKAVEAAAAAKP